MTRPVTPPGWPRPVRPPGVPGWEATAAAWLLDICPPEYRSYPVLRRHAVVLARFAVAPRRGRPGRGAPRAQRGAGGAARRRRPGHGRGRAAGLAGGGGAAARRATRRPAGRGGPARAAASSPVCSLGSCPPTPARTATLTVVPVPGHGAEDVLVGDDGTVYTGTEDGSVFAVRPDGDQVTPGRPHRRATARARVARRRPAPRLRRARAGCSPSTSATGAVETLLTDVDGRPDGLLQQRGGAPRTARSTSPTPPRVHPIERWKDDLVEDTAHRPAPAARPRRRGRGRARRAAVRQRRRPGGRRVDSCASRRPPAAPSYATG